MSRCRSRSAWSCVTTASQPTGMGEAAPSAHSASAAPATRAFSPKDGSAGQGTRWGPSRSVPVALWPELLLLRKRDGAQCHEHGHRKPGSCQSQSLTGDTSWCAKGQALVFPSAQQGKPCSHAAFPSNWPFTTCWISP